MGRWACALGIALCASSAHLWADPGEGETVETVLTPTADARIFRLFPDRTDGRQSLLSVNNGDERSLIRFDLAPIPICNVITSAKLVLIVHAGQSSGVPMDIFRVTRDWFEAEVSWNETTAGVAWSAPGADGDFVGYTGAPGEFPYSTLTADPRAGQIVEWDVTALAAEWHRGKFANHGLMLVSSLGNTLHFLSRENDVSLQPRLVVSHEVVPGCVTVEDGGEIGDVEVFEGTLLAVESAELANLVLPSLGQVTANFIVARNQALQVFQAGALRVVGANLVVESNDDLTSLGLLSLTNTCRDLIIEANGLLIGESRGAGGRRFITLPELLEVAGEFSFSDNGLGGAGDGGVGGALETIVELPGLESVESTTTITSNGLVSGVDGPSLEDVVGDFLVLDNGGLSVQSPQAEGQPGGEKEIGLNVPLLSSVGGNMIIGRNRGFERIATNSLAEVGRSLKIEANVDLTTINLSSLATTGEDLLIESNPALQSIVSDGDSTLVLVLPSLRSVPGDFSLSGNGTNGDDGGGGGGGAAGGEGMTGGATLTVPLQLPGLGTVGGNLVVSSNTFVSGVDGPNLENVVGDFLVVDNSTESSADTPAGQLGGDVSGPGVIVPILRDVGGDFFVERNLGFDVVAAGSLIQVGGGLVIAGNPDLAELDLSSLAMTGRQLAIVDNGPRAGDGGAGGALDTVVELPGLGSVGSDFTVTGNTLVSGVDGPSLEDVVGDFLVIGNNSDAGADAPTGENSVGRGAAGGGVGVNVPALKTVGGKFVMMENQGFSLLNAVALQSVGGDFIVTENAALGDVRLDALGTVGGDFELEVQGVAEIDLSGVEVAGNFRFQGNGTDQVSAQTPLMAATIDIRSGAVGESTRLQLTLPTGHLPAGTQYRVAKLLPDDLAPQPGVLVDGTEKIIDPIAGYDVTSEVADGSTEAELIIDVHVGFFGDLSRPALDALTEHLTLATKAPGGTYMALPACAPGTAAEGCVEISLVDALGHEGGGGDPVFIRFRRNFVRMETHAVIRTGPDFRRGDANRDGMIDVSDPIRLFDMLFRGAPIQPCLDALDGNDSGKLDVSDGIMVLTFLFVGKPQPPAPGPFECGPDPTEDPLTCDVYDACD